MQVSGCGSTRDFSNDLGSDGSTLYEKRQCFLNQCMPCKHMVSFLPLKFCAFCRKHPLPFALSLSFCLSDSTLASALDFTATWCPIRVQISNAVCWPIVRAESSPVCECVTLAIPDNITLSDSIKMRYMSELLPMENEKKRCWNMASQAKDSIKWNSRGVEINSHSRDTLFTFITNSITHMHVIGKKQSEMPDWSIKLRIQRPLCWVCWFSNSSA